MRADRQCIASAALNFSIRDVDDDDDDVVMAADDAVLAVALREIVGICSAMVINQRI